MAYSWDGSVSIEDIRAAETVGADWMIWRGPTGDAACRLPYFDVELALGLAVCDADVTVSGTSIF